MPQPADSKIQFSLATLILIVAFAFITFYRLGVRPLQDYDEAIYAQVAHEAMQSGNQLGFTWMGNPPLHRTEMWFEKPPVMIWLTELSYAVFGVNEFAARFWTALLAVLTLPLVFLFAKALSESYAASFLSVAAFFAAFQFDDDARIMQMDIPVGFFILLALFAFWRARENYRFHFLFWAALALGLMIKSVIGLLPLPVIFVFSLFARNFAFLKVKKFRLGFLLFLVLVLPWHIIESARYGREFWHQYLFYHLLERYSGALEGNSGPFSFYLGIFWQEQIFCWSLAAALIYFVVKSFKSRAYSYIAVSILFIFLFFSEAGTKLPPYILVIYPYAAIAIGLALADFSMWLGKFRKHLGNVVVTVAVLVLAVSGFQNARAKLAAEITPQLVSDKAVGEFLETHCLKEPVYFYSLIRVKPSIIFYADRTVGYFADYQKSRPAAPFVLIAPIPPNFPDKTILYSAETEKVYQIGRQ